MTTPHSFIPIDRRIALAQDILLPDRTSGTALFADISGFTPLTETLAAEFGRKRGAETVLNYINPVFDAIITVLHEYGGSVIGFAGDSITCWLDAGQKAANGTPYIDTIRRGLACAFAMQVAMRQFATVTTPGGEEVALSIKVSLASGAARRFAVGNPEEQLVDVLAGDTLQRMAAAEGLASGGEIVVSREVVDVISDDITVEEWRTDAEGENFALISAPPKHVTLKPWPDIDYSSLNHISVQEWILNPIHDRLSQDNAFLGELRPVTALFCKFAFIDFDNDDAAGQKFDRFVRWVQAILSRYGGTLIQLTIGDKGSFFYAAFGSPYTYGDDTARAMATALDLQQRPSELAFITTMQTGISRGQVWSGSCGGDRRRTFGVMGNQVNMSARLMGKAENGQILVNAERIDDVGDAFEFENPREIQVKGREAPLPVITLVGRKSNRVSALNSYVGRPLVGRNETLSQLMALVTHSAEKNGQRIVLHGPAGIGKSHLAAVVCRQVQDTGWQVATALCQSVNQTTLYYPWQQLFQQLLGLAREPAQNERQSEYVSAQAALIELRLTQMNADWLPRLPLLGDLLGLPIEDSAITAGFDPQLRQESLFALVLDMLRWWSTIQPVLLFVDSAESIDSASLALLQAIEQGISKHAIVLLMAQIDTPSVEQSSSERLQMLEITPLSHSGVAHMVRTQLSGTASGLVVDLIHAQAHGNPYFTRELVRVLRDNGQIEEKSGTWVISAELSNQLELSHLIRHVDDEDRLVESADLTTVHINLPDSVHNIVLARIDRLPERQKLTLKVASVLGHVFHLNILVDVHPADERLDELRLELTGLKSADFTDEQSLFVHLFKHSTEHDVAYETLLFAQRRDLHRAIAEWYESLSDVPLEMLGTQSLIAPNYALIAFHWQHAEDVDRERIFTRLAGRYSAENFANTQAVRYFTRALSLTPTDQLADQFELLFDRERVFDWMGEREKQAADLDDMATIAQSERDTARVHLRRANLQRWIGEYDQAILSVTTAIKMAESLDDAKLLLEGHFLQARLQRISRNYPAARNDLEKVVADAKAMSDHKIAGEALLDLGTTAFYLGDYPAALEHYLEAEKFCKVAGDTKNEAGVLAMRGMVSGESGLFSAAKDAFYRALTLCQTIGYTVGEINVLGNLGVVYEGVGNYSEAEKVQLRARELSRTVGDREGESYALSNLALIYYKLGKLDSAELIALEALTYHDSLNDRRSEGFTRTYLAHTLSALGRVEEAHEQYHAAIDIRESLNEGHLVMDVLAGLAQIAHARNQSSLALEHAERVLNWVAENDVELMESPLDMYWRIFNVLIHYDSDRAADVLKRAKAHLERKANAIQDEAGRKAFVEEVTLHRSISQA